MHHPTHQLRGQGKVICCRKRRGSSSLSEMVSKGRTILSFHECNVAPSLGRCAEPLTEWLPRCYNVLVHHSNCRAWILVNGKSIATPTFQVFFDSEEPTPWRNMEWIVRLLCLKCCSSNFVTQQKESLMTCKNQNLHLFIQMNKRSCAFFFRPDLQGWATPGLTRPLPQKRGWVPEVLATSLSAINKGSFQRWGRFCVEASSQLWLWQWGWWVNHDFTNQDVNEHDFHTCVFAKCFIWHGAARNKHTSLGPSEAKDTRSPGGRVGGIGPLTPVLSRNLAVRVGKSW